MTKKPETVKQEDLIKRETVRDDEIYENEEDGLVYDDENTQNPFTGTANKFHKNSQLMLRGNFIKGLAEGLWERYHDNGQLSFRTNYKNGKREGLHEEYSKKNQLLLRENYKTGKLVE